MKRFTAVQGPKYHQDRRAYAAGQPLRSTMREGSKIFNRWMNAMLYEIPSPKDRPGKHRHRILALEAALQRLGSRTSRNVLYGYLANRGASVDRLWELGEAFHDAGVTWASGPVALASIPEYSQHLFAWFGTLLLLEGPSGLLRDLWPVLKRILTVYHVAWPSAPILEPVKALRGSFVVEHQLLDKRLLYLNNKQRALFREAWGCWRNSKEDVTDFPWFVAAAITQMASEERKPTSNIVDAAILARHNLSTWMDWADKGWRFISESKNWDVVLRPGDDLLLL